MTPATAEKRKIKRLALEFRNGILGTRSSWKMCFAVCAPLEGYMSALGYEVRLEKVDFGFINHVWLRLLNGNILDPTADQFNLPKVYIGPVPEIYTQWMNSL